MKFTSNYFLLILFAFASLVSFGQNETLIPASPISNEVPHIPKQYYYFSPRISVTIPNPMTNKAFKKCFVGIYEISAGLNIMVYKGLFIGGTYKNALLKITENKIADFNARMEINNVGIKVGADAYLGDKNRIIFSASVSAGQNQTIYSGLISKNPAKKPLKGYTSTFIEPEVNLFFLVESNFGIGATVSYSLSDKIFDPYELCLNDWSGFDKTNPGATGYLSFGFGFYYSLVKKKNK